MKASLAAIAPPSPTITSSPAATSATTSASFGFTDTESGVSFSCSLDGAVATACASPKSYLALAQGAQLSAAGVPIRLEKPSWARFAFPGEAR